MKAFLSTLLFITTFAQAQAEQRLYWEFDASAVDQKKIKFENPRDSSGRVLMGMQFDQWDPENTYLEPLEQHDFYQRAEIRRSLGAAAKGFCENNYQGSDSQSGTIQYEAWHMAENENMLIAKKENEAVVYGTNTKNKLVINFFERPVKKGSAIIVLTGVVCQPLVVEPKDNTYGGFLRSSHSP